MGATEMVSTCGTHKTFLRLLWVLANVLDAYERMSEMLGFAERWEDMGGTGPIKNISQGHSFLPEFDIA